MPPDLAGTVASAGATIAGLLLIFLGAAAGSFATYDKGAQRSVLDKFRWRAWIALIGFIAAAMATCLAILGSYFASVELVRGGLSFLFVSLIYVLCAAVLSLAEIK